jgi:hypothetical protein
MARTSYIQGDVGDIHFVLDFIFIKALLDFYNSLKQTVLG